MTTQDDPRHLKELKDHIIAIRKKHIFKNKIRSKHFTSLTQRDYEKAQGLECDIVVALQLIYLQINGLQEQMDELSARIIDSPDKKT